MYQYFWHWDSIHIYQAFHLVPTQRTFSTFQNTSEYEQSPCSSIFVKGIEKWDDFQYWATWIKRVNCEIRPGRPNGPIGEPNVPISTCPKKVGPILSHGPPVRTKAQTCPLRFKKLVLQAWEACPASLRDLLSRSERLAQQVCEACSARKGGRTSPL